MFQCLGVAASGLIWFSTVALAPLFDGRVWSKSNHRLHSSSAPHLDSGFGLPSDHAKHHRRSRGSCCFPVRFSAKRGSPNWRSHPGHLSVPSKHHGYIPVMSPLKLCVSNLSDPVLSPMTLVPKATAHIGLKPDLSFHGILQDLDLTSTLQRRSSAFSTPLHRSKVQAFSHRHSYAEIDTATSPPNLTFRFLRASHKAQQVPESTPTSFSRYSSLRTLYPPAIIYRCVHPDDDCIRLIRT